MAANSAPARCWVVPAPGRPVEHRVGRRLGRLDQVGNRLHRVVGIGNQDERDLRHKADEREVLERVVGQLLVHRCSDGVPARQHDQGVPVGRGASHLSRRNSPAGSRPGFHDYGLPQAHRQSLGDDARNRVDIASAPEAVHQRDGSFRPGRFSQHREGREQTNRTDQEAQRFGDDHTTLLLHLRRSAARDSDAPAPASLLRPLARPLQELFQHTLQWS